MSGKENDLFTLLERLGPRRGDPALCVSCGTEDALYAENRRFVRAAAGRDLSLASEFGPGAHDGGTETPASRTYSPGCR